MKAFLDLPKGSRALIVLLALAAFTAHAGPPSSSGPPAATGTPPVARADAMPSNDGPPIHPAGPALAKGLLAWNAEMREATVHFGAAQTVFSFQVTNVSQERIVVTGVRASCGCTVPKLPALPWALDPGSKGTIEVAMTLAGKQGIVSKPLTVLTDHGFKVLAVRTNIIGSAPKAMSAADRAQNLQIASANRQAVLQGECASCHATPALGKTGAGL